MGKDERGIVLSSGQKDRTLQNGRAEIHGLAVFHELLEQPQDLLVHWWASSCCKAAKILRSGCRRTLRFIILVGNVSSVIDNFKIALTSYNKHKKEADIHIHNTGRDKPPGVRNWYEFKNTVADLQAQFECQKQNIWWDKKMVKNRMIILPIILFIMISFFVAMFVLFKSDAMSIIVCAIGIILKVVERIIEHYSYHKTSIKIDAIQSNAERELTAETVKELQELIDERREIPVLEINIIHKLKAKRYSSSYEETS